MPKHKRVILKLLRLDKRERHLFWVRFSILTLAAALGLLIGLYAKEVEHLTFALVGMKVLDNAGEALAEAIASVEEGL